MIKLTYEQAEALYDILVEECGANPDPHEKWSYARYAIAEETMASEYRFQGNLGFGGKIKNNSGRVYVCCYREHETPARLEMMARADARIKEYLESQGHIVDW